MNKYRVTYSVIVEADNRNEAKEKFEGKVNELLEDEAVKEVAEVVRVA